MKNVIVAWTSGDEQSFENHVPLLFVGQRNQQLGFSANIHVLFLQGFNRLSAQYKDGLQSCGFVLHDVEHIYNEYRNRYAILQRFGDYETKCFLRWLIMQKFFADEPIIHYDGDIVFNEDPAIIEQKIEKLTFFLQGCPAFTVISDCSWFNQYQSALDAFVADIEGYSDRAWQQRAGWQITFNTRWSGSRFRPIISSDQDLLSHLVHAGTIKQDPVEHIQHALDEYIVFQNPLLFHMYHQHIPYFYERENGIDYFSYTRADGPEQTYRKRVLLWHMQSCFTFYASKYMCNINLLGRLPYNPSGKLFQDKINKFVSRFTHHTLRLRVYDYFFNKHDFNGLMNGRVWWKKGVFK